MVIDGLRTLGARWKLVQAAEAGHLTALECAMPICACPNGRSYFEPCGGRPRRRWAPSADRYPVLGRDGGTYTPGNVRLSHLFCNLSESGRLTARVRRASGQYWTPEYREHGHRMGVVNISVIRAWEKTPEGHAARVERGRCVGSAPTSDRERALSSVRMTIQLCARWNLARGKACVCGHHATA